MDEKLKSENTHKRAVFYVYVIFWGQSGRAGVENGAMLTTYLFQIYFRMHHFVVKFSKFFSPQAARGHWPPNQNPADVPGSKDLRDQCETYFGETASYTRLSCSGHVDESAIPLSLEHAADTAEAAAVNQYWTQHSIDILHLNFSSKWQVEMWFQSSLVLKFSTLWLDIVTFCVVGSCERNCSNFHLWLISCEQTQQTRLVHSMRVT